MQIKVKKYMISGLLSAFALTSLYGATATLPNTFVAHTPARASQVNENFLSLKSAIDDNDATKQNRVSGTCAEGEAIRTINANGTVVCEEDSDGNIGMDYATDSNHFIGGSNQETISQTITAPVAGYVIATYTAWLYASHTENLDGYVEVSLLTTATHVISSSQMGYRKILVGKGLPTHFLGTNVSTQYIFPITAGTSKKFRLLATAKNTLASLKNQVLTLQFFPNRY